MAENWQLKAVLSANSAGMIKALKGVNMAAKNTRKYLLDIGNSGARLAGQLGMPLGMIAGLTTAFSVAGLKSAVSNFAALGDEVVKSAKRIGVSTAEYQRLKYIAEQSGVSAEELGSSVGRLNKNIAEAAAGKNKDFASLMKHAGISLRDANGELRSGADLLPEVADLMARNKNAAVQARIGNAMFGKSWATLAPLLQDGSAGIEALTERYKMLGIVVDEEDLKAGEKLGDQISDLKLVTIGFGNSIAKNILPILSPLIEEIIKWGVANKELIATEISEFVKDISKSLKDVDWNSVIKGALDFVRSLVGFVEFVGGAKNALIGLAIFMNAGAIMAFIEMGASVLKLVGFLSGPLLTAIRAVWLVMMANPIVLIIAAVVALAYIIYKNWDSIVNYVSAAWGRIKSVFDVGFFDGLIQIWLEAWQGMANGIIGIIKELTPDSLMPDSFKNFKFTFATDRADALTGGDKSYGGREFRSSGDISYKDSPSDRTDALTGGDKSYGGREFRSSGDISYKDSPSLVNAGQVKASGQIEVSFKDVPVGTRIDQKSTGDVPIKSNVGYRSYALGNN